MMSALTVVMNSSAFNKMLAWLGADREQAGQKYREIHNKLVFIFSCRGCQEPENLADQTFNRVLPKIDWLVENYVGDPMLYFRGIARNLVKEDLRGRVTVSTDPSVFNDPVYEGVSTTDPQFVCLDRCMEELPTTKRDLLLSYYEFEGNQKIVRRKKLADELGTTLQALRLRVFHLRAQLKKCMEACMNAISGH